KGDKKSIGLQTGRRFFNGEKFRLPLFLLLNIVVLALFFGTIADLISLSLNASPYNHILLIPLVSGYFLFSAKKDIFSETGFAIFPGTIAVSAGLILFAVVE
ncbi:MAG: hypothetical protein GTO08_04790, partial [Deltaproteobacteria bacterium]|nr:hypothetical protein [Deltaproteobacteria bacterium]